MESVKIMKKRKKKKLRSIEMEALKLASEEVDNFFGACPNDIRGWNHPNECFYFCNLVRKTAKCWATYWLEKAEKIAKENEKSKSA